MAEQVMAGPQYRRSGTIRLRITADGFATVADPALTATGSSVVCPRGTFALDGTTCAALAKAAGVDVGPPAGLYTDYTDVAADETLRVDPDIAAALLAALRRGDEALRRFAPDQTPVLWPEHFDVGISTGEVTYGVSPGDGYLDEPYAYVGPWAPRTGEFWNSPFGAARPLRQLAGDALDAFFAQGAARAHG